MHGCRNTFRECALQPPPLQNICHHLTELQYVPRPLPSPTKPSEIKNSSRLIYQMACLSLSLDKQKAQFPQWSHDNYKAHRGAKNRNLIVWNGAVSQTSRKPLPYSLTRLPFTFTMRRAVTGVLFFHHSHKHHQRGDCVSWPRPGMNAYLRMVRVYMRYDVDFIILSQQSVETIDWINCRINGRMRLSAAPPSMNFCASP